MPTDAVRSRVRRRRIRSLTAAPLVVTVLVVFGRGFVPAANGLAQGTEARSGISLSPSVVMLEGQPGQSHRQTLRLTNHTTSELSFTLEAQDVVAVNGRRTFLAAGERADSVAATAVFSPATVVIPPGGIGAADVTLTVPAQTAVRAVAAVFRGQTPVGPSNGVAMTASLGCLLTFSLSPNVRLEVSGASVTGQAEPATIAVTEWVENTGTEPVVPGGTLAVLSDQGTLVGKVPVEPQRLLPGERLEFGAEYPTLLGEGRYRAVLSLGYLDQVVTSAVEFTVPPGDRRAGDQRAAPRP